MQLLPALLLCLIASGSSLSLPGKLFYLSKGAEESKELLELTENPYSLPVVYVDCLKKNCERYRIKGVLPLLVLWSGPGTSYKHLGAPSLQALDQLVQAKINSPLRPIEEFLMEINLLEAFGVGAMGATLLWSIFRKIFRMH